MLDVKKYIYNLVFALNTLLVFLFMTESLLVIPTWLQVFGRMHPIVLHFPIALVFVFLFWHFVVLRKIVENEWVVLIDRWLLLMTAFATSLSALMGFFLSKESGYDADAIFWHKWSGMAIAILMTVWYGFAAMIKQKQWLHYGIGAFSALVIIATGHLGGALTHGPDFILKPIRPIVAEQTVLLADAELYTHLVQPILQTKCYSCHNQTKSKGNLRMDTEALLLKGGKNGKLWDTTAADLGLLMRRAHLPLEDKKHMPPIGKPQLTENELYILKAWIQSGASFDTKITAITDETLQSIALNQFKKSVTDQYAFDALSAETIQSYNTDYRIVAPIAKGSPALQVNFFSASAFSLEHLKDLLPIKEQIVQLNLNKMPLKDDGLSVVAKFPNLQKLNLSSTQITGKRLAELNQLSSLQQLSLSGTEMQKADILALRSLKQLNKLFLWNTTLTASDIQFLKNNLKGIAIDEGFTDDTTILKLTPPIILNEEQVITSPIKLKLKHYINGAVMRYTMDGSEPDSLKSPIYRNDVVLIGNTTIKAKAFKEGWISSNTAEISFFSSKFKPDSAIHLLPADKLYIGDGPETLIDLAKGEVNNFRSKKWVGYKLNHLESLLMFNQSAKISSVTLSTLVDIGSYIMPPESFEVWGGNTAKDLKLLGKLVPTQPTAGVKAYLRGFEIRFAPISVKCLKVVVAPVSKLPKWHPGKGEKGWVFVDEVYVN